jgi:hypothetical protein
MLRLEEELMLDSEDQNVGRMRLFNLFLAGCDGLALMMSFKRFCKMHKKGTLQKKQISPCTSGQLLWYSLHAGLLDNCVF